MNEAEHMVAVLPVGTRPTQTGTAAERVRQAARLDCPLHELREFARDPDLIVRATVAMNHVCGREIDEILAADDDERIRALLAGRVARLLADLGEADRQSVAEHMEATLHTLVTDQATRVRVAIADALATTETAPRSLVLKLACDEAGVVSDRVIRLSPLLSDADLLALLAAPHSASAAESIASRERLSAVVADAIVQKADAPTIRALLSNQSACIRESTLDALIGRAPAHVDWHAPLVLRPLLSAHAVRALSEFITSDLLRILAFRTDLEPSELEVVRRRLASHDGEVGDSLLGRVRHMQREGILNDAALLAATHAGDTRLVLAQLAVASGVALLKVERVLELRSAKALLSLVWRGGFSMRLAVDIQNLISQFGPDALIPPAADGGFPLTEDEMNWQIELITGVGSEAGT